MGLGSDYLRTLLELLDLPGSLWLLDLPGDGSNRDPKARLDNWQHALLEVTDALKQLVMIGHSRGGMFLLSLPELQERIEGLVLMDTAPDRSWEPIAEKALVHSALVEEEEYANDPNDETLRRLVLAGAPSMFTKESFSKGLRCLTGLPYNHLAYQWTLQQFEPTYSAKWIPLKMPTMVLSGAQDVATPLRVFSDKKEWHRSNISFVEIEKAGHFPWIDNPVGVVAAFKRYSKQIESLKSF